ncbi:Alpha/Beta hydrolase protein [Mycena olivaceomarginata]|nr:Alpha/Beta hydrolase protein [Mycena olivaceomarginata]
MPTQRPSYKAPPTLVLIHPIALGSEMFHPIYADPRLRRFNLLTLDLRGHGSTSAPVDPHTYGRETAAKDVLHLMDTLKIPASHLMGVSMGSCIALQMAIFAPERVLSICMFSPLPLIEPPEVMAGRQEIWDYWMEAFSDPQNVDSLALKDAMIGGLQGTWNNRQTNLSKALTAKTVPDIIRNWAPKNYDLFHGVAVNFFLDRPPHPVESLGRIHCPVAVVHCSEDLPYPIHHAQELLNLLQSASVAAQLFTIDDAPHYGNVTHFEEANDLLYEFLLANSKGTTLPPVPPSVESPFLANLVRLGFQQDDEESDSDGDGSLTGKVLNLSRADARDRD